MINKLQRIAKRLITLVTKPNEHLKSIYVVIFIILVTILSLRTAVYVCKPKNIYGHVFTDNNSPTDGYILIPKFVSEYSPGHPGIVNLIDRKGRVVHSWITESHPHYARLLANGDIYVNYTQTVPDIKNTSHLDLSDRLKIQKLDWNSKILWEYKNKNLTHMFDFMPNDQIVSILNDKVPDSFSSNIVGGTIFKDKPTISNALIVIDKYKRIIWQWHAYEHLDPQLFPLLAQTPTNDWSHMNSVKYIENNPITHTNAFLISARHLNTIFLIDYKTGDVIWKSAKGMFFYQHDATLLPNGHILAFNNANLRENRAEVLSYVTEVNPLTNKTIWNYLGGDELTEQGRIASSYAGGAQRLPNGNTFITVTQQNKLLEVNPEGKIVWEFVMSSKDQNGQNTFDFNSNVYYPKGAAWANRINTYRIDDLLCRI